MIVAVGIAVLLGAASWTFLEYALHNWNGHLMKGKTPFSRLHLKHHADPDFFAPTSAKIATAAPVLAATAVASWFLVGGVGLVYTASLALAYAAYEVAHRRVHTHPPRNAYGRWMRKHHLAHHFTNPRENHGVTSPIWDLVFRTHTPTHRVRVPERLATRWLLEDGDIAPAYREDYVLARPASRRKPAGAAAPARAGEPAADDLNAAYAGLPPV